MYKSGKFSRNCGNPGKAIAKKTRENPGKTEMVGNYV
jgi:hypothetical protein